MVREWLRRFYLLNNGQNYLRVLLLNSASVTRLGDLLDFGQFFKAFRNE